MQDFNIGSLQILGPGVTGYILQIPVAGLDAPDYRVTSYDSPGQDGGVVSAAFYSTRTITLQGVVQGVNPAAYEANRAAFSTATSINRDANNYPVLTPLTWTTLAGASYFINVQMQKPSLPMNNVVWTNFQIIALAPDPRIYGVQQVNSGSITLAVGGGYTYPVIYPITFANSSGGGVLMTNAGNEQSNLLMTFTGPLTNPLVYNFTTGYSFQLDYTIPSGVQVVVDTYQKTVVYGGSTNFRQYVDPNNNIWLTAVPGNNSFMLSTASNADTGNVDISFYPAYIGV